MKLKLIALCFFAAPAFAQCPPVSDITGQIEQLAAEARTAENEMAGRAVSDQMWQLWLIAPDEPAQEMLDAGMRARTSYDYHAAIEAFSRLIDYCPAYAEGYNQRGFIQFLRQDYEAALVDLDAALARSSNHVGAQSGRALTLMNLGRIDEARVQLREALENNPWLSERALLNEGAPLAPVGQDI
ncbi:tetratricopeptide repeat protein [Roseobacter denitrificans]|uniref:TPR domain protein n=1 Tax=Roseobacter denitrificans (strain ATCC 33942 / OCh 114) TaxID=375451 RepID=Q166M3_ROSDO|nr:tetratricopeptide repeat protein [Roseobacter denitrificans]ABG32070.1 TPR domain protein [Roseobacter denitrificans OCh 114]AVL51590.1 tetratricopeptide repeat protein [Roseobacter denitrificans]SFF76925.1 Tetratricopeptide repeat-containing protein [Roseobacter denitrificans OCh 114]